MADEVVRLSVVIVKKTTRAYVVDHGGDKNAIVPQSLVKVLGTCQGLTTIELPEWLALNEEMI